MNCLLCGQKLGIFRKLSLGDFCCQEHRAQFTQEQSELGLARLIEAKTGVRVSAARVPSPTRLYSQFFQDEILPSTLNSPPRGYFDQRLPEPQLLGPGRVLPMVRPQPRLARLRELSAGTGESRESQLMGGNQQARAFRFTCSTVGGQALPETYEPCPSVCAKYFIEEVRPRFARAQSRGWSPR